MRAILKLKFKKGNILIIKTFFGTALKITGKGDIEELCVSPPLKDRNMHDQKR